MGARGRVSITSMKPQLPDKMQHNNVVIKRLAYALKQYLNFTSIWYCTTELDFGTVNDVDAIHASMTSTVRNDILNAIKFDKVARKATKK